MKSKMMMNFWFVKFERWAAHFKVGLPRFFVFLWTGCGGNWKTMDKKNENDKTP